MRKYRRELESLESLIERFLNQALDENKQQQDMQQPLHPWISEAQRCRALSIDHDRPLQVLERCFADEAVVADALDVKQTPVGGKADLAEFREIFDAPANVEVPGIVDGRFGSKRLSLLVILLDAGFLYNASVVTEPDFLAADTAP